LLDSPYQSPQADLAPSPSWVRYRVLACFCVAATVAYIDRNGLGVAVPVVRAELGLSREQMGWVLGSFFATYSIVQIPTGWLASQIGSRAALTTYALLWSLATAMVGLANGFVMLLAAQLALGAAQSGLFPCATSSLARWLPSTRRGLASGALASFMSVGSSSGLALTGLLLEYGVEWRSVFVLFALPGLLWAAWFGIWFRNDPAQHASVNEAELEIIYGGASARISTASEREPTPWLAIVTSRAMWCICLQQVFRAAGYVFYASWYPTFLRETRGVSIRDSGLLASLPLAAVIVGSPLGGVISDALLSATGSRRIGRQWYTAGCMLLCAALIVAAYQVENVLLGSLVIAAGSFCAALGGPSAYAITMDMGGKHVATVFSTMNAFGALGSFAFPVVVPYLAESSGWGSVMGAFAGIYAAAAVAWVSFNPDGTIQDRPARAA
jgi:ACS family glucarate transporter-like MFS transporter